MKVLIVTMYPNPRQPAFGTFVKDQAEDLIKAGIEGNWFFQIAVTHAWCPPTLPDG